MITFVQDVSLLEWAGEKIKAKFDPKECTWISNIKDGEIQAVVVYARVTGSNCDMSVVSNGSKRWFDRTGGKAWFGYPFNQLKVRRVSAVIPVENKDSINACEKLGFVREGTLSHWFGDTDGYLYCLLKENCKWIKG